MSNIMSMTKEEMQIAIKDAVNEGISNALTKYGFDVANPTEMQKDMIHIRKNRIGCENVRENIIKIFLTVSIPGGIWLVWDTAVETVKKLVKWGVV